MERIQERLRKLMESYNVNHWQLARRIHVEEGTIRRWLRDSYPSISDDNFKNLAEFFGVHEAYLRYGIDDELITYSLELQKYDPETLEKIKEIIRIILDLSKDKRTKKYIEEYRERRQSQFSILKAEHERLLKEIINNLSQGKVATFSARSEDKEDIEKFRNDLNLLFDLRGYEYIKLPGIKIRMNNLGKLVETGPCELTLKGEGLIEYLTEK
jgi:transcriptional regulator with XRE-family HTH domain